MHSSDDTLQNFQFGDLAPERSLEPASSHSFGVPPLELYCENHQTQKFNVTLLITLLASLIIHGAVTHQMRINDIGPVATKSPLHLTLKALSPSDLTATQTSTTEETDAGKSTQAPQNTDALNTEKVTESAANNPPPAATTAPKQVNYRAYRLPRYSDFATESSSTDSNIFHPQLQQTLRQSKAHTSQQSVDTPTGSYRDISGQMQVNIDGKCFRESNLASSQSGTDWYITNCPNRRSEGDDILSGLEARLEQR